MAFDVLLEPPTEFQPAPARHRVWSSRAADASVLAALGWWGTGLAGATGGRQQHVLSTGLALVAVALVLVRPWQRVRPGWLVGTASVAAAAFLVTAVSPTGWAGASEAASWTHAAAVVLLLRAWLEPGWRRQVVVYALVLAPLLSFARGWTAWWGGADPSHPFIGTFYWHNQQAVFLVLGALVAAALLHDRSPVVRLVGWLAVALCGAGTVFSTSRASMAVLVLAVVCLVGAAVAQRDWRAVVRWALALPVVAATSFLLSGPPFFPSRSTPLSGAQARADGGETLAANGGHRLDDWADAVQVFRHWPLSGTGFHGFADGSRQVAAAGEQGSLTPFAHNGFLQLLVDGGLLLAVPVLASLALLAGVALRDGRRALQAREWTGVAALAALGALALHSAVDFDWSYPALLTGFGITAVAALRPAAVSSYTSRRRLAGGLLVLGLVVLGVHAAWHGGMVLNVPLEGRA